MIRFVCFLAVVGLLFCGQVSNSKVNNVSQISSIEKIKRTENALAFINGYLENANRMKQAIGIVDWVNSNKLSTDRFKKELKRIIDKAYKNEPELGVGADPIFDAQDNPDEGFVLDSFDGKSNYLVVRGVDMPDFKVVMKIKNENGVWLVDGCGIINIPAEKRAKR